MLSIKLSIFVYNQYFLTTFNEKIAKKTSFIILYILFYCNYNSYCYYYCYIYLFLFLLLLLLLQFVITINTIFYFILN
jgi:hypothetical protein